VYEIYKVGEDLHWVEGMGILANFGFDLVVVPHWNNAEGGTHDTRRCFMGELRFRKLESRLPEDLSVLGLDEHTACIFDLASGEGQVRGLGRIVYRRADGEMVFKKGDRFPLDLLRGKAIADARWESVTRESEDKDADGPKPSEAFWDTIHRIEGDFQQGIDQGDPEAAINALLQLDQLIWQAKQDLASEETVSQAREIFREFLVLVSTILVPSTDAKDRMTALVDALLSLREEFRRRKQWEEADGIRDSLDQAGVVVEDTPNGVEWKTQS
jgi:hypothetical protein